MLDLNVTPVAPLVAKLFPVVAALIYWLSKLILRRFAQRFAGLNPGIGEAVAWAGVDFFFIAAAVSLGMRIDERQGWGMHEVALWYLLLLVGLLTAARLYAGYLRHAYQSPAGWRRNLSCAVSCWLAVSLGLVPLIVQCKWLMEM